MTQQHLLTTPLLQAPKGYAYGFVQYSRAWYSEACKLPDDVTDELMVGLYADEGGCHWEFAIRWHNLPEVTPRVEVFSDAWQAFVELPEVFAELARRDTLTPLECCALLEGLGFIDRTPAGQRERTPGQQPTELNTPWALHFDRDGTEDFGIICDAEGNDLVASHLPQRMPPRWANREFGEGYFWLPEEGGPVPLLVRQMQLMTAAPKLLAACRMVVERWERGNLAEAARACQEAIEQASGDSTGRVA